MDEGPELGEIDDRFGTQLHDGGDCARHRSSGRPATGQSVATVYRFVDTVV